MELSDLYDIARMLPDFDQFEQYIKSRMTGEPITGVIDAKFILIELKEKKDE